VNSLDESKRVENYHKEVDEAEQEVEVLVDWVVD